MLLAGMAPFLGETKIADTCQATAFSVSANISVSIFVCIITKSEDTVKVKTGFQHPFECNDLGENAVAAQWFLACLLWRNVNIPDWRKWGSSALHGIVQNISQGNHFNIGHRLLVSLHQGHYEKMESKITDSMVTSSIRKHLSSNCPLSNKRFWLSLANFLHQCYYETGSFYPTGDGL